MNIEQFLKDNDDARLTYEDKWMVWSVVFKQWTVYQRSRHWKSTRRAYEGDSLTEALRILGGVKNA